MSEDEPETVKVVVMEGNIFGAIFEDSSSEETLDSVIENLQAWRADIAEISEEFAKNAKVEIDSVGGWEGEHHATIKISYRRPETEKEAAKRRRYDAVNLRDVYLHYLREAELAKEALAKVGNIVL